MDAVTLPKKMPNDNKSQSQEQQTCPICEWMYFKCQVLIWANRKLLRRHVRLCKKPSAGYTGTLTATGQMWQCLFESLSHKTQFDLSLRCQIYCLLFQCSGHRELSLISFPNRYDLECDIYNSQMPPSLSIHNLLSCHCLPYKAIKVIITDHRFFQPISANDSAFTMFLAY